MLILKGKFRSGLAIFLLIFFAFLFSLNAAAVELPNHDAYHLGYQHGTDNKGKIVSAVELLTQELKAGNHNISEMLAQAQENQEIYLEVIPGKLAWMKGVADATQIPYDQILLLNSYAKDDCTTFIAHGTATKDGVTIIGKNRDLGATSLNCVELVEHSYPPKENYRAAYINIPQVKETYKFIGVKSIGRWGFGQGINEYQVSVSDNDMASMDELSYTRGLHDNDYIRLALERSKTGREAVDVIAGLTEKYGQAWNGIAFEIGDPQEVWVMEVAGYQWVAKKYTNTITARANQFQIEDDYDLASEDLITYAQNQGWVTDIDIQNGKINFKLVYGAQEHYPGPDDEKIHQYPLYGSEIRYQQAMKLLKSKRGEITAQDIMNFQRDHYDEVTLENGEVVNMEQTPYFSSQWYEKVNYPRQICHHAFDGKTTASTVIVSKDSFNELGLMWAQLGQPCESIYVPFHVGITSVNKAFASTEAPTKFELIRTRALGEYAEFHPVIRDVFDPFEKINLEKVASIEKEARKELLKGNIAAARQILTDFSNERAELALDLADLVQEKMTAKAVQDQSWSK